MAQQTFTAQVITLDWEDPQYQRCHRQARGIRQIQKCRIGSNVIAEYTLVLESGQVIAGLDADARQWIDSSKWSMTPQAHRKEGAPGLAYQFSGYDQSGRDHVFVTYTLQPWPPVSQQQTGANR